MAHKHPTAIIMQGGAMRGAFGAGVVYELGKRGVYVDTIAASSASVPTSVYYAARQFEEIRKVWTESVGSSRFIRYDNLLFGKPIFDIEYLIGEILKKKYPLSLESLSGSKTKVVVPLYNYETSALEVRTSEDQDFLENIYTYFHLAMIVHEKHILRGTPFEKYVDGALDPFVLFKVPFLKPGTRVIVIWNLSKFDMHAIKYLGQKIFTLFQSRNFPDQVKRVLQHRRELVHGGARVYGTFCKLWDPVVIKPAGRDLAEIFDVISRDNKSLGKLFEHGREKASAALDSGVLKDFL